MDSPVPAGSIVKQGLASHGDLKISVFTAVLYLMQKLLHILRSDGSGSKLLNPPRTWAWDPDHQRSETVTYVCIYIIQHYITHSKRTPHIPHYGGLRSHGYTVIPMTGP